MRSAALIAYPVLILLGYVLIFERQQPPVQPLTAVHDLAAGRRLVPGDVVKAGAESEYVKRDIKAGEPLKPGDIVNFPVLNAETGTVPVVFEVGAGLVESGDINVGAQVQICKDDDAKLKSLSVKAVVCDRSGTICWAVVAIPADQSAALSDLFSKEPPPRLKSMRGNSSC